MTDSAEIHGIYPMLYAMFDSAGAIDSGAVAAEVEVCVANGAHGIAVGGLASECNKLSTDERRILMEAAAAALDGRLPLSVTIAESNIEGQVAMVRAAHEAGAAWAVLQPPPVKGASEAELIRFYGAVADASPIPIGIQNAPEYIGIGVSNAGFAELNRRHPNVSILKAEGPATYIAGLAAETGGVFRLLNGRNGIDLIDSLHAGCHGMIPSVETVDVQTRIYEQVRAGEDQAAERAFSEILPLLYFLMQSIDHLLCYGKRLTARRISLAEVHDRAPSQAPTAFGLEVLERWSKHLPNF
jgi:4-hydroxy-tetrahydrodipicolinate synthase